MHIVQSLRVNEFFASAVAGTCAYVVGSLVEFEFAALDILLSAVYAGYEAETWSRTSAKW